MSNPTSLPYRFRKPALLSILACLLTVYAAAQRQVYFPQAIRGDVNNTTRILTYNPGTTRVDVTIRFFSQSGQAQETQSTTLEPDGSDEIVLGGADVLLTVGWVEVMATEPILATAFYTLEVAGAALPPVGVLPVTPANSWRGFGDVAIDLVSTGLAVANQSPDPAECRLTTYTGINGQVVGVTNIELGAGDQTAQFLPQLIPDLATPYLGGFGLDCDQPVVPVALTQRAGDGAIAAVAMDSGEGATQMYLPQAIRGNAQNTTRILVQNPGDSSAGVTLRFFDQEGQQEEERLTNLEPDGSDEIVLGGPETPLGVGWVELTATRPILATAFYALEVGGTSLPPVGVLPVTGADRWWGFGDVNILNTGLAVANPETGPGEADCELTTYEGTEGQVAGASAIQLGAGQQIAQFLPQLIQDLSTPYQGGFSLDCHGKEVVPVALTQRRSDGAISAVAMAPASSGARLDPALDDAFVAFPTVGVGEMVQLPLQVANIGSEDLLVEVSLVYGAHFSTSRAATLPIAKTALGPSWSTRPQELVIPPGDVGELLVRFEPRIKGYPITDELWVTTNDPQRPVVAVPIWGEASGTPTDIDCTVESQMYSQKVRVRVLSDGVPVPERRLEGSLSVRPPSELGPQRYVDFLGRTNGEGDFELLVERSRHTFPALAADEVDAQFRFEGDQAFDGSEGSCSWSVPAAEYPALVFGLEFIPVDPHTGQPTGDFTAHLAEAVEVTFRASHFASPDGVAHPARLDRYKLIVTIGGLVREVISTIEREPAWEFPAFCAGPFDSSQDYDLCTRSASFLVELPEDRRIQEGPIIGTGPLVVWFEAQGHNGGEHFQEGNLPAELASLIDTRADPEFPTVPGWLKGRQDLTFPISESVPSVYQHLIGLLSYGQEIPLSEKDPHPHIELLEGFTFDFLEHDLRVGSQILQHEIKIRNQGTAPLSLDEVQLVDADPSDSVEPSVFELGVVSVLTPLQPGETDSFVFALTPNQAAIPQSTDFLDVNLTLKVTHDAPRESPLEIPVSGRLFRSPPPETYSPHELWLPILDARPLQFSADLVNRPADAPPDWNPSVHGPYHVAFPADLLTHTSPPFDERGLPGGTVRHREFEMSGETFLSVLREVWPFPLFVQNNQLVIGFMPGLQLGPRRQKGVYSDFYLVQFGELAPVPQSFRAAPEWIWDGKKFVAVEPGLALVGTFTSLEVREYTPPLQAPVFWTVEKRLEQEIRWDGKAWHWKFSRPATFEANRPPGWSEVMENLELYLLLLQLGGGDEDAVQFLMRDLGRHEFLDKLDAKAGRLDDELLTYLHNAQLKAIFPDSVRRAHKALGEWAKQEIKRIERSNALRLSRRPPVSTCPLPSGSSDPPRSSCPYDGPDGLRGLQQRLRNLSQGNVARLLQQLRQQREAAQRFGPNPPRQNMGLWLRNNYLRRMGFDTQRQRTMRLMRTQARK